MAKGELIIGTHDRSVEQLKRLQGLPLEQKVNLSLRRIKQFHTQLNGMIYVAFSGGKDSTVLLHLVRSLYSDTKAVFCNTGVEYPEIVEFVRNTENVEIIKPKMSFSAVLKKYGFPMVSKETSQKLSEIKNTKSEKLKNIRLYGNDKGHGKLSGKWEYLLDVDIKISHKCCDILKKNPSKKYEKETGLSPIIGTMASESRLRKMNWLRYGCNAFSGKRKTSTPLSFWSESDIWEYIKARNIRYSVIYEQEERTGCMYCLFGCQYESHDGAKRFDRMKEYHPKQYRAAENLGIIRALEIIRPPSMAESNNIA